MSKLTLLLNLEDQEQTIMIVLFAVAIALLVGGIISFALTNHFQNNLYKKIKDFSNSVRVYVVDIKNETVNYFNSSKLRNRSETSITSFYTHFDSKDRQKLISWIGDLVEDAKDVKTFMEIGAYVKRFKQVIPSILQVQKVDLDKKIVYLESYLLGIEKRKTRKGQTFVSKDYLLRAIRKREGVGYSFCVNFFNKFNRANDISDLAYIELKNIISSFASDRVFINEYQDTRFFITNFECDNKMEALNFIERIKEKINSYLLIESFSDDIDFTIGAAENTYFKNGSKTYYRTLNNLSDLAKDIKQEVIFFDESKKAMSDESSFKTEVENIIEKGKLQYLYQPIYSFKYGRVTSYTSTVIPLDTVFKDIDELKRFAVRTDDDKELFTTIVKNSVSTFIREKGPLSVRLFLPVSLDELVYAGQTLNHITDVKDANVVLQLDEKEIQNLIDKSDYAMNDLANSIRTIKSKGFSVALIIENDVLNLSPNIYSLFDYYILRMNEFIVNKKLNKIPTFKALVENLIRYNKSIVALDIPSWDAVDLVYKFGIENVSGDPISEKRENIVPIERKTILKIRKLKA